MSKKTNQKIMDTLNESKINKSMNIILSESTTSWCGLPGTIYRYNGDWNDPEIEAGMCLFNEWDAQDYLGESFEEDAKAEGIEVNDNNWHEEFAKWVQNNQDEALAMLSELQPTDYGVTLETYLDKANGVSELKELLASLKNPNEACWIPDKILDHAIEMCEGNEDFEDDYDRLTEIYPEVLMVISEELKSGKYHWSEEPFNEACNSKKKKAKKIEEEVVEEWKQADSMMSDTLMNAYIPEIQEAESLDELRRIVRKIFKDDRIDDRDYDWLMDNTILEKYKALGFEFPEDESTYEVITKDVDSYKETPRDRINGTDLARYLNYENLDHADIDMYNNTIDFYTVSPTEDNDGYLCATNEFLDKVDAYFREHGMNVNTYEEGESALGDGMFSIRFEELDEPINESAETGRTPVDGIEVSFKEFPKEVAKGKTPEERKNIFYKCYVVNPYKEEMERWTVEDLVNYIKETDDKEYYKQDLPYIKQCCMLCGLSKEETDKLCNHQFDDELTEDVDNSGKPKTFFKKEGVEIFTTGHDWDFIAVIYNLNDHAVCVHIYGEDEWDDEYGTFLIEPDDYVGLLADDEGRTNLERAQEGHVRIEHLGEINESLKESAKPDIRVDNIAWETDGDDEVLGDLPSVVEVTYEDIDFDPKSDSNDVLSDKIGDYLSDKYGYLHNGFDYERFGANYGTTAEAMCAFIADLFRNESEDFESNLESLYDWCEGGDSFYNAGYSEEECQKLIKLLNEVNPLVQQINKVLVNTNTLKESNSIDDMQKAWKYVDSVYNFLNNTRPGGIEYGEVKVLADVVSIAENGHQLPDNYKLSDENLKKLNDAIEAGDSEKEFRETLVDIVNDNIDDSDYDKYTDETNWAAEEASDADERMEARYGGINESEDVRIKQLQNSIDDAVGGLYNAICADKTREPFKSEDEAFEEIYPLVLYTKSDGKGLSTHGEGVGDDFKFIGKDTIRDMIIKAAREEGLIREESDLTEGFELNPVVKGGTPEEGNTVEYGGYIALIDEPNYDAPSERLVQFFKSKEDFENGDNFATESFEYDDADIVKDIIDWIAYNYLEEVSFDDIENEMSNAKTYDELRTAVEKIEDDTIKAAAEDCIDQCERDGDPVDVAYSVTTTEYIDPYRSGAFAKANAKSELTEDAYMDEWRAICQAYCDKIDAELLFVNLSDFGYRVRKTGELVHMYADELYYALQNLKESKVTVVDDRYGNEEVEIDVSDDIVPYLDMELEDDFQPHGGKQYADETVKEFIMTGDKPVKSLKELNADLINCGIKPIGEGPFEVELYIDGTLYWSGDYQDVDLNLLADICDQAEKEKGRAFDTDEVEIKLV